MQETIRSKGMNLAIALLLFAAGMHASATHSDDAPMEVPSEISPVGPEPVFDPDRALKLSPSDTENALHITLSEVRAPQESAPARKGGAARGRVPSRDARGIPERSDSADRVGRAW